ncbi:DUF2079 domain-containing protein [Microtetraspora malaysiensis]|uniref:DUF2079 domain-containing protein n=1 Tax=Microtetraspora malaysiensis TaxID=161358 RepID=A0ABW6SW86_9ACTN
MTFMIPWGTAGRRPLLGRTATALTVITAAAAVLYSAAGLIRLHAFRLGTYDLVIFDQAVRSYSRFGLPVSIAKGVHNDFGPDFSVLGDHWSPILASLAPSHPGLRRPGRLLLGQL